MVAVGAAVHFAMGAALLQITERGRGGFHGARRSQSSIAEPVVPRMMYEIYSNDHGMSSRGGRSHCLSARPSAGVERWSHRRYRRYVIQSDRTCESNTNVYYCSPVNIPVTHRGGHRGQIVSSA